MPTYTVHTFLTHCFVPTALRIGADVTVEPLPGLPATEVAELIAAHVSAAVGQNPMPDDVKANVADRIAAGDDRRAAVEQTQDVVLAIRDALALRQLHRGQVAGFLVIQTDRDPPELYAEARPRNVDMRRVYNLDDPGGEGALIGRVVTATRTTPKLRQYLSLYADAVSSTDTIATTVTREARLLKLWILLEVMAEQEPATRTAHGQTTTGKRAKVENLYDRYNLSVHPDYQGQAGKNLPAIAYALRNVVAHAGGCEAATGQRDRNACRAYGHLLPHTSAEDGVHIPVTSLTDRRDVGGGGMGAPKRVRSDPTDDWQQLRLRVRFPEQETYELLRPIVLFGQTAAERAEATGVSERTLDRKAARFDADGMASLFPTTARADGDRRRVPADLRHRILALKAEHPPFRPHEIAAICRRRDDCRVSHKTVQRILAEGPLPSLPNRRYPPYAQIPDGAQRRLAIVHLYFEGWNVASIAGYLETTRTRVYETLHRFFAEGFAGLPDKSHAPKRPARKVDFRAMAAIRRLQANPELGEFRVHAALRQMGIHLSPRTCGRIMALNRHLGLPRPAEPVAREPRPMPFAATYRHEYWSVDVRYVEDHGLPDPKPVYAISILENYSRALLASIVSPRQDLTAYLLVLRAALAAHGSPLGIVSDGGGIFKAGQVLEIYRALGIERYQIEPGAPWQNYVETHFDVMRRMADRDYAEATSWTELRAAHDRFFTNYNHQAHLAHRQRADGRRSPAEVLGWVQGVWCDEAELDRLFRLRSERVFDRGGYVRFRRWRMYGERGLAGRRGAVWLSGEVLTVAYDEEALAQYRVGYAPESSRIVAVTDARLFPTRHPSPQPFLGGLEDVDWRPALPLRPYAARRPRGPFDAQLRLLP